VAEGVKESCAAPSDALTALNMLALGQRPQGQGVRPRHVLREAPFLDESSSSFKGDVRA